MKLARTWTLLLILLASRAGIVFAEADTAQPLVKVNQVYARAVSLYESKNWTGAIDAFSEFISISERSALYVPAVYYLAYCYQQLKESEKSAVLYQRVIQVAQGPEEEFWSQMAQKRLETLEHQ